MYQGQISFIKTTIDDNTNGEKEIDVFSWQENINLTDFYSGLSPTDTS